MAIYKNNPYGITEEELAGLGDFSHPDVANVWAKKKFPVSQYPDNTERNAITQLALDYHREKFTDPQLAESSRLRTERATADVARGVPGAAEALANIQNPLTKQGLDITSPAIKEQYDITTGEKKVVAPPAQVSAQPPAPQSRVTAISPAAAKTYQTNPSVIPAGYKVAGDATQGYWLEPTTATPTSPIQPREYDIAQGFAPMGGALFKPTAETPPDVVAQYKQAYQQIAGQPSPTTQQDEIKTLTDEANQDQQNELSLIESEIKGKVDLSKSTGLVKRLVDMLETKKEETPSSMEQKFLEQRKALGVGELETSLSQVDANIKKLDADYASTIGEEEGRQVSMPQIRRRQSAQELAYNRMRRDLIAERDSIANQLNMKYGVVNSMMQYAGMDYDNAQQNYQTQWNATMQLTNLIKGIEDEAKSDQERKIDNARANIQIMSNLIKSGNISYEQIDESMKLDIKNMEIQAGLPIGFTSFVMQTVDEPIIHFGSEFTDATGNRIQPITTIDKSTGNISVKNVNLGVAKVTGGGGGGGGGVVTKNVFGETIAQQNKQELEIDAKAKTLKRELENGTKDWAEAWNEMYDTYSGYLEFIYPGTDINAMIDNMLDAGTYRNREEPKKGTWWNPFD